MKNLYSLQHRMTSYQFESWRTVLLKVKKFPKTYIDFRNSSLFYTLTLYKNFQALFTETIFGRYNRPAVLAAWFIVVK
jgi:hypothetical protein